MMEYQAAFVALREGVLAAKDGPDAGLRSTLDEALNGADVAAAQARGRSLARVEWFIERHSFERAGLRLMDVPAGLAEALVGAVAGDPRFVPADVERRDAAPGMDSDFESSVADVPVPVEPDEIMRQVHKSLRAPGDPVDDALKVLAEYVTLPYEGRRLVEDAGSPERVRADARNREMMERVLLAAWRWCRTPEAAHPLNASPDLVSRMLDARACLRGNVLGLSEPRGLGGAMRWLDEGILEGMAQRALCEELRPLVAGEPHVCSCGHDEESGGCSEGFEDRCRFEAALRRLLT